MNQSFKDFEVVVVANGEEPLRAYDPLRVRGRTIPARVACRPRSGTIGFRERHHSLGLANGRYVAWLNCDNLGYPDWLRCHHENVAEHPGPSRSSTSGTGAGRTTGASSPRPWPTANSTS